jgi:hypothetical protein
MDNQTRKYDRTEAEVLIADVLRDDTKNHEAMDAAAKELLAELEAMNDFSGARIEKKGAEVGIHVGTKLPGWVEYKEHSFVIRHDDGKLDRRDKPQPQPLPLRFNPSTKTWEGEVDDAFFKPEPGKPGAKRAALAVIIEAVLKSPRAAAVGFTHVTGLK